ncbi:MAG: hypothetical protein R3F30_09540 [Planctomycetota bacterium]
MKPGGAIKLPDLVSVRPEPGSRVLLLAPPGELASAASRCLDAVGARGRVVAAVRGEPACSTPCPSGSRSATSTRPGPPASRALRPRLVWGSLPFVTSLPDLLEPVRHALRPGGALRLDLPTAGYSTILASCHPGAAAWLLPDKEACRGALAELGLRDVELHTWVELHQHEGVAELVEALVAIDPLRYEGRDGRETLEVLRQNLASAFHGAERCDLALRRLRASARR